MKLKRTASLLLAVLLVICSVPMTALAAAEVTDIDGVPTVFLSNFGKINFNGKANTTFKKINEAVDALGKDGGKIFMAGTVNLAEFSDPAGRNTIDIEGTGTLASGNILDLSSHTEFYLGGNMNLDFLHLRTKPENFIYTNGNIFSLSDRTDTPNSASVAVGKSEKVGGIISLVAGTFDTVASGAALGGTVNGDPKVRIDGGAYTKLVNGNIDGTTNGNTAVSIYGGNINTLYAGPLAGTVNGNVVTEIHSATVKNAIIGAQKGATVNGNLIFALYTDDVESVTFGEGVVSGKKIVIATSAAAAKIPAGADYVIEVTDGKITASFDGNTLKGFDVRDAYGLAAKSITVNGAEISPDTNGLFAIPAGTSKVEITPATTLSLNKNANYVAGYEDGTFRPQNNMTKAEAVVLLTRLLADESFIKGNFTSSFNDVEKGSWYESYIGFFESLDLLKLISLRGNTEFAPTKNITRAEFAQLIYEVTSLFENGGHLKLGYVPDLDFEDKLYTAASSAIANGIVTGYEDGTFRPDNNVTRAEVVTMINRLLGRTPTNTAGEVTFADTGDHWANGQILAACNPEGTSWTATERPAEYTVSGTSAKEYVTSLYDQSKVLSAQKILDGIDKISQQMKKDVLETPNTADIYGDKMTGPVFYISEKNGDDSNDGKTPETAWKTPAATSKTPFPKKNTTYLFERGGVYRGNITVSVAGMILGSYGTGEKPVLMQSKKNYADPALWEKTEWENVWKCTDTLVNVGVIAFDHDVFDHTDGTYNEIFGYNKTYNHDGFTGPADLKSDLEFYSVERSKPADLAENVLYLYSEKNPGERFTSIEIGENKAIVSGTGDDVIIDNISFKFTGGHGMGGAGGCKNRTVTNCVFSWLGGSVLDGTTLYGNAVEIYGSCDGYFVENNWMYQIFDTGVTHQFNDVAACIHQNVRYYENLIEYCYWGIEFYNKRGGNVPDSRKHTKDVHIAYNVLNESGYGWGSKVRDRDGYAYCGTSMAANYDELTEYNIINKCSGWLILLDSTSTEVHSRNFYIQTKGHYIGNIKSIYNVVCDNSAAGYIGKGLGAKEPVVIVLEPEE